MLSWAVDMLVVVLGLVTVVVVLAMACAVKYLST